MQILGERIKPLPSAQPGPTTEISEILNYLDTTLHPIVSPDNWNVYAELHDMVSKLPSTQHEIVRCKDCKHYGCILYSGTQFEYGECFGHEESDYTFEVKPDDFCSRAEMRTDEH